MDHRETINHGVHSVHRVFDLRPQRWVKDRENSVNLWFLCASAGNLTRSPSLARLQDLQNVNVSRMALVVGALLVGGNVSAQVIAATAATGLRTGTAAVITKAPVIDGKLDDDAWKSGEAYTDFIQRELREGEPVTERTE